jgi:hypothetical protein
MSITTVITATTETRLATLDGLKSELGIVGDERDDYLGDLLDQSSATIETYLNRVLWSETVSEVFRDGEITSVGPVWLSRWPGNTVTSVTVDGNTVTDYEVDPENGALYRLDADGDRLYWQTGSVRKIVVVYTAGYDTMPLDIVRACLDLTKTKYYSQLRDPSMKSEEIPGVIKQEFWVGQVGSESGGIPSLIASSIDSYRRFSV